MIIPYTELEQSTLMSIIEGFVLREGTEYGAIDCNLADKVQQVFQQLKQGDALLVYSELHETVNIVPKDQLASTQEEY